MGLIRQINNGKDREDGSSKVLKSHQSIKRRLVYEDAHHAILLIATLSVPGRARSRCMPAESQGNLQPVGQRCYQIPCLAQLQLGSIFLRERNALTSPIEEPLHQGALVAHLRPEGRHISHIRRHITGTSYQTSYHGQPTRGTNTRGTGLTEGSYPNQFNHSVTTHRMKPITTINTHLQLVNVVSTTTTVVLDASNFILPFRKRTIRHIRTSLVTTSLP